MYVYFESDEQTYLRYAELARQGKRTRSSNPVRIGLANETGFPHEGTVDFVDNQVDPTTGTIRARAVLPNPDRVFTPGLFARVQVQGSRSEEHTSELQSLMRISYAAFCLKKKNT